VTCLPTCSTTTGTRRFRATLGGHPVRVKNGACADVVPNLIAVGAASPSVLEACGGPVRMKQRARSPVVTPLLALTASAGTLRSSRTLPALGEFRMKAWARAGVVAGL
jgi:hypothetical protein